MIARAYKPSSLPPPPPQQQQGQWCSSTAVDSAKPLRQSSINGSIQPSKTTTTAAASVSKSKGVTSSQKEQTAKPMTLSLVVNPVDDPTPPTTKSVSVQQKHLPSTGRVITNTPQLNEIISFDFDNTPSSTKHSSIYTPFNPNTLFPDSLSQQTQTQKTQQREQREPPAAAAAVAVEASGVEWSDWVDL